MLQLNFRVESVGAEAGASGSDSDTAAKSRKCVAKFSFLKRVKFWVIRFIDVDNLAVQKRKVCH
jgi:hypothetical protein